ncbi:MAG: hypothetical protein ACR2JQ_04625 [Mycobacteriales bacterium]
MRRLLVILAAALAALLATATAASADPVSDAAQSLTVNHRVYVAPGAQVTVDESAVDNSQVPILVAALPDVGNPRTAATKIGSELPVSVFGNRTGVVVVISGIKANADSGFDSAGDTAIQAAGKAASQDHPIAKGGDATAFVQELKTKINAAALADSGGSSSNNSDSSSGKSNSGVTALVVVAILIVGGIGLFAYSRRGRRRREQQQLDGMRAEVVSLYDRLGADVSNLDAGDDKIAKQAIADAAERYTATGSQLSQATGEGEFTAARRTALEGLQAAQTARKRLGLDPGPDLPPIAPERAERLDGERAFDVEGRQVRGYPDYRPGAPYFFNGGGGYGAGWYSFPFWETMLIGSMIGGGWGGWGGWGGGGYGYGYDSGFDAGYDQGSDNSGGGDWGGGGGGGGDWGGGGGGGGDWGGGGGGGDWGGGGGGGDWGGGGGGDGGGGGW